MHHSFYSTTSEEVVDGSRSRRIESRRQTAWDRKMDFHSARSKFWPAFTRCILQHTHSRYQSQKTYRKHPKSLACAYHKQSDSHFFPIQSIVRAYKHKLEGQMAIPSGTSIKAAKFFGGWPTCLFFPFFLLHV